MKNGFKIKYDIKQNFLPKGTKRRPGIPIQKVDFIVAHDTGNANSTAINNISYYKNSANNESASAHIFVDDKTIIECIPALENPEKAWHVLYNVITDNSMFGDDANDVAIGVEYCYGTNINPQEAYKRYIWVIAYLCYLYNLDPAESVVGHCILDPKRKSDPKNALSKQGISYEQFLKDVVQEYMDCLDKEEDKDMLEKWQEVLGTEAVKYLSDKGILNSPDDWIKKLEENTPNWLFFEVAKRIYDKLGGK